MTVQAASERDAPSVIRFPGGELRLLYLLVIGPMLVRLWLAAAIPLTEDEAYYRLWALAPALSYYDHPPMVAWMMAAGLWLIGDTALGLRFAGVVATAVSTVALWRTAHLLIGGQLAIVATAFAVVIPLLAVGAIIMTPDTPSVLFFVLGAWALAELNASSEANWWLAVGLFAGLGLLSKYTNLFFGLIILTWLLSTKTNWHWFRTWQLYAGGALALAIFTPVILWNITYDGASFTKQFGRVVDVDGFKPVWQLELWGALILLVGPVIFWLAARGFLSTVQRAKPTPRLDRTTGDVLLPACLAWACLTELASARVSVFRASCRCRCCCDIRCKGTAACNLVGSSGISRTHASDLCSCRRPILRRNTCPGTHPPATGMAGLRISGNKGRATGECRLYCDDELRHNGSARFLSRSALAGSAAE